MWTRILGALSSFGAVGVALSGTAAYGTDKWVTWIAITGIAVTVFLNHLATVNVRDDLRNGRLEEITREAIEKMAKEKGFPLEIKVDPSQVQRPPEAPERRQYRG